MPIYLFVQLYHLFNPVFPKLCAADEAEVWRERFMFWQNLLYVTSLPLQSLWRVGFYKVGVPRPNLVFIIVCRNEIKFEKRCFNHFKSNENFLITIFSLCVRQHKA